MDNMKSWGRMKHEDERIKMAMRRIIWCRWEGPRWSKIWAWMKKEIKNRRTNEESSWYEMRWINNLISNYVYYFYEEGYWLGSTVENDNEWNETKQTYV
jgi:hypothetical protein